MSTQTATEIANVVAPSWSYRAWEMASNAGSRLWTVCQNHPGKTAGAAALLTTARLVYKQWDHIIAQGQQGVNKALQALTTAKDATVDFVNNPKVKYGTPGAVLGAVGLKTYQVYQTLDATAQKAANYSAGLTFAFTAASYLLHRI